MPPSSCHRRPSYSAATRAQPSSCRRRLDRLDDVVVAGAAADVAVEIPADLGLARARLLVEQRRRRHHHARGAEAALQAVVGLERRLDHAERAVGVGHALDGPHLGAVDVERQHVAGLHRDRRRRARRRRRTARCRSRRGCRSARRPSRRNSTRSVRPSTSPETGRPLTVIDTLGTRSSLGARPLRALARRLSTVSMAASVERRRAAAKGLLRRRIGGYAGARTPDREGARWPRTPTRPPTGTPSPAGLGDPCRRPRRHTGRRDRPAAGRDGGRAGGGGPRHRLRGGRDDAGVRGGGRPGRPGGRRRHLRAASRPRRGAGGGGRARADRLARAPMRRPTRCRAASTRRSRASGSCSSTIRSRPSPGSRAALRPGGRLVFVAWGPAEANPWFRETFRAAVERLGPSAPAAPNAPGPLAFADRARVLGLLRAVGLGDCAAEVRQVALHLPGGLAAAVDLAGDVGPAKRLLREKGGTDAGPGGDRRGPGRRARALRHRRRHPHPGGGQPVPRAAAACRPGRFGLGLGDRSRGSR